MSKWGAITQDFWPTIGNKIADSLANSSLEQNVCDKNVEIEYQEHFPLYIRFWRSSDIIYGKNFHSKKGGCT